jgi:hypothetical protein
VTNKIGISQISSKQGRVWFEQSLEQGAQLASEALERRIVSSGRFYVVAPGVFPLHDVALETGGVVPSADADACLASFLKGLVKEGASCLLVESELARAGDPGLKKPSSLALFFGDRLARWCALEEADSEASAIRTIAETSSGYPLNAFVTARSPSDLGLVDGQSAPVGFAGVLLDSLCALIVSAFDAESFAIWKPE